MSRAKGDSQLFSTMPEVFAPPPQIEAGYMQDDVAGVMRGWNPLFWEIIKDRHLIARDIKKSTAAVSEPDGQRWWWRAVAFFRSAVIDRIWRA